MKDKIREIEQKDTMLKAVVLSEPVQMKDLQQRRSSRMMLGELRHWNEMLTYDSGTGSRSVPAPPRVWKETENDRRENREAAVPSPPVPTNPSV